ncbi:metallophosphoesterase [Halococcus saccharolyticus]|uniref:Metallophosphoesterase n=1 Tax=Halococcus saccharolyticus DSM 5350 TaxID=1227455 RepID=M0MS03_9EURY|nr:metallophosphoesterase [Halococcus saccharolyticus]EMA47245.1 metallophosphoesterase [Halococcus saccharolyticus DSM 5350]
MARAESGRVEPVPGESVAVIEGDDERALCVADYHAGLEAGLGRQGVELPSQSRERREHLLSLLDTTGVDRVVFLGDLAHAIGGARGAERDELTTLFAALDGRASVTVVKGNHDGEIDSLADDVGIEIDVTPTDGTTFGDVGLSHGHTWPSQEVLECEVVCIGHEHPTVRLEDDVGGSRAERAWLRGRLAPEPFRDHHDEELAIDGELVVFPAFNDLSGGTWVNVPGQEFLAPFLPDGLAEGEAYLLDGTRLGTYRDV